MTLKELGGDIVFAATDGGVALMLIADRYGAGLVLMEEGRVMRILLDEPKDVDLLIDGLKKLKERMKERGSNE